jgi:hypothetical protein
LEKKYQFYNSITRKEYATARERDIPIFIFVDKNVLAEYDTYKQNKDQTIKFAHVESVNIFRLLDEIVSRERNNFIRGFERFDDIAHWLKEQWAGLFADFLGRRSTESSLRDLSAKVSEMGQITNALKEYSELLVRKLQPDKSEGIIGEQARRIEASRIKAFAAEPMIGYLLHSPKDATKTPVSPADLYHAFGHSRTPADLLKKAGFLSDFVETFMKANSSIAEKDYASIKDRYFPQEMRPSRKRIPARPKRHAKRRP